MPPDHSALLAHIVSQTRQNVEFLVAHNEISRDAGQRILAQIPTASDTAIIRDLSDQTRRIPPDPSPPPQALTENDRPRGPPPSGPPVRRLPQSQSALPRAKALWAYNENGSEPNDLSFREGDIIEVVAETNADWWTGKHNGKQGLFPSNYVEKLSSSGSPPSYPSPSGPPPEAFLVPYSNSGPPIVYPPTPQPYNPYLGQPGQQQVVVQQESPPVAPKPNRFGGLGNVLATSAVGGVGFGAGSAIGSGIVHAIF